MEILSRHSHASEITITIIENMHSTQVCNPRRHPEGNIRSLSTLSKEKKFRKIYEQRIKVIRPVDERTKFTAKSAATALDDENMVLKSVMR